jgi:hypothetical protein
MEVYDNLRARREAREMARAFVKQKEPEVEYREGEGFSTRIVAWVFILGVFVGAFLASGGEKFLRLH